ncbi:MAG: amidohydrolase [Candidatus Aminicenantes bacterium]|nr:amidohydrolase [Candidatus Aminicenantes bacterium]MDH5706209.1 amidohydrolase [Candidatus Aminicenantes bacterium]
MIDGLKKDAKKLTGKIIEWRRDFHRHPEIAYQEKRTSSVIRQFLESLDIPVTTCAKTGLRGILEGIPGGKTVALRADIDALPLKEEGDKEYISENPEAAHACGHDGHMAILMGAVELLSRRKDRFKGNVVFLFQPSEERIPGGAKKMIEEGALEGVDAAFGLHLWQPLPTGSIGIVKGAMMAQPDDFSITVKGKGGHGSMPHTTVDPILVASHLVVNIQSIVSRNVDPLKPVVVSFGTVKGGTIYNIIPGEVSLTGTVRTFDSSIQSLAEKRLREITEETCKAFGATAEFEYEKGYPPLVNHEAMVDFVLEVTAKTLGKDRIQTIDPVMGGEDFAYFLQKVPGAFLFFGMGDGMEFPHHHPAFDLDEKALPQATLLMTSLALEYLGTAE